MYEQCVDYFYWGPLLENVQVLETENLLPYLCVLLLCYEHSVSGLFRIVFRRTVIWRKDFNIPGNFRFQCQLWIQSCSAKNMLTTGYTDHLFSPHSRQAECNYLETRIKRMTSDGKVATISVPIYAQYLAKEAGYKSALKFPCALDGNLLSSISGQWNILTTCSSLLHVVWTAHF